jgi:hypothetical protein
VAFMCVLMYLYCCSRGCLCQGLQGPGVVCSWYVSGECVGGRDSVVTGWGRIERGR